MDANLTMALVVFGVLFLTLAAGIWVGFSLFIVGFVGMMLFSSLPAGNNMASSLWATVEKWEYVALPLFILMGEILYRSGISEKLFKSLVPWLYRLPGGLLLMNIVSCTLFAAVSGSSAATTATVGRITLAEFDKLGYDKRLAMGSLAGAGTLGFLIPPSLIMIVYANLAEVSSSMSTNWANKRLSSRMRFIESAWPPLSSMLSRPTTRSCVPWQPSRCSNSKCPKRLCDPS